MSSGILGRKIPDSAKLNRKSTCEAGGFDAQERSKAVSACFDARADTYAEHAVVQRAMAAWLAEWLEPAEPLRELSALELGAGDGCFTGYLADRVKCLTAIDEARRMVQRGRSAVPSARWQVGNAWSVDAAPVDRLYSASLLQWCPAPRDALAHWRRVVKPGGRMLHGFYVAPTLSEWESLAGPSPGLKWRPADEWEAAFRATGWRVLRREVQRRSVRFDSALALLRFFHKTGAAIPVGSSAGRLRRILQEYDERFAWAGGLNDSQELCQHRTAGGVVASWMYFRIEAENVSKF
jgi:ubiquinone/menaquinone biosynthesis C-methylase UbiE